jgi:hypothetical protein
MRPIASRRPLGRNFSLTPNATQVARYIRELVLVYVSALRADNFRFSFLLFS